MKTGFTHDYEIDVDDADANADADQRARPSRITAHGSAGGLVS